MTIILGFSTGVELFLSRQVMYYEYLNMLNLVSNYDVMCDEPFNKQVYVLPKLS